MMFGSTLKAPKANSFVINQDKKNNTPRNENAWSSCNNCFLNSRESRAQNDYSTLVQMNSQKAANILPIRTLSHEYAMWNMVQSLWLTSFVKIAIKSRAHCAIFTFEPIVFINQSMRNRTHGNTSCKCRLMRITNDSSLNLKPFSLS